LGIFSFTFAIPPLNRNANGEKIPDAPLSRRTAKEIEMISRKKFRMKRRGLFNKNRGEDFSDFRLDFRLSFKNFRASNSRFGLFYE
jgi:hypothetical protein